MEEESIEVWVYKHRNKEGETLTEKMKRSLDEKHKLTQVNRWKLIDMLQISFYVLFYINIKGKPGKVK